MQYAEREALKTKAWKAINSKETEISEKAWGMLAIIEAHYWRAREDLEAMPKTAQRRIHGKRYLPGYQLDIDVYTRHWLASNTCLTSNTCIPIPSEVIEHVKTKGYYTPEKSKFLQPGQTSYRIIQTKTETIEA